MNTKPWHLPICILLVSSCAASCNRSGSNNPSTTDLTAEYDPATAELRQIQNLEPAIGLQMALARNDTRFLAAGSNGIFIPGVNENDRGLLSEYGFRVVSGMLVPGSPPTLSPTLPLVMQRSLAYTEEYNRLLKNHLVEQERSGGDPRPTQLGILSLKSRIDVEHDPAFAELREMRLSTPETALRFALERSDRRFLASRGFAVDFPGVERGGLLERYGYRVVSGTTDAPNSKEWRTLNEVGLAFIQKYNLLLALQIEGETKSGR